MATNLFTKAECYRILGSKLDASFPEVKKNYLDLAKMLHPDKHDSSELATKKFQELQGAFEQIKRGEFKNEFVHQETVRPRPADPAGEYQKRWEEQKGKSFEEAVKAFHRQAGAAQQAKATKARSWKPTAIFYGIIGVVSLLSQIGKGTAATASTTPTSASYQTQQANYHQPQRPVVSEPLVTFNFLSYDHKTKKASCVPLDTKVSTLAQDLEQAVNAQQPVPKRCSLGTYEYGYVVNCGADMAYYLFKTQDGCNAAVRSINKPSHKAKA